MKLNENIKQQRIKQGMTLKDVSTRLGVSEATVQRYESGAISNIPYDTIVNLAKILDCSPMQLMGWDNAEFVCKVGTISRSDMALLSAYNSSDDSIKKAVRVLLGLESR